MSIEDSMGRVFYHRVPEFWRKESKLDFLSEHTLNTVDWCLLVPNHRHTWLVTETEDEFAAYIPIGSKEAKRAKSDQSETVFKTYSGGIVTRRDAFVYDFNTARMLKRMKKFVDDYNTQVAIYQQQVPKPRVDDFVNYERIKWDNSLKTNLGRQKYGSFDISKGRTSLFRPFTKKRLYFDSVFVSAICLQHLFFPDEQSESENQCIISSDIGYRANSLSALITHCIAEAHLCASTDSHQCFPFYTYDQDGSNRRENITDWALDQFRSHYNDPAITKWDIFYYVYGLLHHPGYRERYALDLKRNLPHIPFAPVPHPKPLPHKEGGALAPLEKWDISPELERRMQSVARELRKNPTSAENQLWLALRKRQLDGRKFRRQVAIGAFVVDFYCASERLAVEVDGPVHDAQVEADRIRQELIESLGIRFVRLTNEEVEHHSHLALEKIRAAFISDSDNLSSPSLILGEGAGGWGKSSGFHAFSRAGQKLADLHLNFESVDRYELDWHADRTPIDYKVVKMLPRGKSDSEQGNYKVYSTLKYNDSLTLQGIPERAFAYRLGNRSALDWIVDQYRVKTDKRSGITHDPNGYSDDPQYILKLIERVITVSLRTVDIVEDLAKLPFRDETSHD